MKKFSRLSSLTLLALAATAGLNSCVDPVPYPGPVEPNPAPDQQSKFQFKQDLEQAILQADRIVVLQHSHRSDFTGIVPDLRAAPQYSYGSRVLSAGAKADFVNRVRSLPMQNNAITNSLFAPHHTIKFYSAGALQSTMKVGFPSGSLRWNGSQATANQSILQAVAPVIRNAGFTIKRDWAGLARIEFENGRRGSSPDSADADGVEGNGLTSPPPPQPKPVGGQVPTAKPVPGKPGMVFNPFTQNQVDVNGIPSGTKVRDPNDNNPAHVFRVP